MYGSVRGAISDGRPYRDSYPRTVSAPGVPLQENQLLCTFA
jgi:hypothetical protein